MKIILFNQNPMITKLLESVSKKLELSMEDFNHYQELSTRLKKDPEWILIADDECLEKLDQVDWLELKETISQNKNSVCMYKKGNEVQPFLEGFEMKIKKPFLPTEVLKVLQKKLGSNMSELEPSQNLDPTQEVLETNWDELENLGDLEALVQEEPNNEEQLLPTLNDQEEKEEIKEEIKEEVKEEVKETPQEEEKPKDDEIQEGETLKDEEVSKELEMQEEVKEEEQAKEQEPIKEETQENKEEKQEKTQDSPSAQELEAMQELVKEIQENSNGQEDKKETQENTETPQETETQELEIPKEETQESAETPQETETQELETPQESAETPQETPQEKETQKLETPQDVETPQEKPQEKTQKLETQEDHYESIEDIPEPVMAQAMGEELPFLNEAVAKITNNENDTETPKESVIKTPQEKEESDKTSSPLELHLNLQDLLKSLNQESLKSLLENKTLSIKITLEDKKPDA
ncbi:chemotaxis regulatory protein ChePep [Helicobacter pylori]|uniref:chemotaxis regulatory protein ChePep n=1 Tax=Helicobacter pylori TaxID=210 RepID=UPI000EAEBBA7|nr:chemotaxis regulatory protein ChePep [Helicobacter pylori]